LDFHDILKRRRIARRLHRPEMHRFKDLPGIPNDVGVVGGVAIAKGKLDANATSSSSLMTQRRRLLDEVVP